MKHLEARPKKALSAKSKLSKLRDTTGKFEGQWRAGTKLSRVLEAQQKVSDSSAVRKRPKAPEADTNVGEYAAVLAHAVDTFGSRTRANAWLNRPSRIFNNQSPLQILTQDPAAVEEELVRIDHGIFF
jgi:uncharacterized protein (DUF2384 family)